MECNLYQDVNVFKKNRTKKTGNFSKIEIKNPEICLLKNRKKNPNLEIWNHMTDSE